MLHSPKDSFHSNSTSEWFREQSMQLEHNLDEYRIYNTAIDIHKFQHLRQFIRIPPIDVLAARNSSICWPSFLAQNVLQK